MRQSILRYGGQVPTTALARRGISSSSVSGTGVLKSYVASTPALSAAEKNVLVAFLALFGRVPERSGLSYWASQPSSAEVSTAVNAIFSAVSGSLVLDPDDTVMTTGVYLHLLGKTRAEDPAGVTYWAQQIQPTSIGNVVSQIAAISSGVEGFFGDTYRNRILVAESVARLQKYYAKDLSTADSRCIALRVEGTQSSYDEAMSSVYRLLVSGGASPTTAWERAWTSATLFNSSRVPDNSPVRQLRSAVWYNRSGKMMRATLYLPNNFSTGSFRAIILAHGGGWRINWPESLEWLGTALAASFVVLAPTYTLSAFGGVTPVPENDIEDFYSLVSSSSFLRCDPAKVGLLGESAGGHLCLMRGVKADAWRVFTMYAPANLTGVPPVSAGLEPYVNYYAPTSANKSSASPELLWNSSRNTLFKLWHGQADTFVPPSQSVNFANTVGAKATLQLVPGEGHGFSTPTRSSVLSDALSWFSMA